MRLNVRTLIVAVILGLVASLVIVNSVAAQTGRQPVVTASIGTTVSSIAERSWDATPNIIREGQRWKPAEKIIEFTVRPVEKTAATVRFNFGGIDEPWTGVDPQTGARRFRFNDGLHFLSGYQGSTRQLEIVGSYEVRRHLRIQGAYMRYTLEDRIADIEPLPGFNQGAWTNSYWQIDRYRALEFGVGSDYAIEKLGLHGDVMWAPFVNRHWNSKQVSRGMVFENDSDKLGSFEDARTQGLRIAGLLSYELARTGKMTVDATFGYNYRLLRSTYDYGDGQNLHLRQATAGLRVGF